MTDEPKKFAEIRPRQIKGTDYTVYDLFVGSLLMDAALPSGLDELQADCDKINAEIEAEVERRLDEITRRAAV